MKEPIDYTGYEKKVVLVHDWLISLGGSEKVLKEFVEIFPRSDIYTLFYDETLVKNLGLDINRVYGFKVNAFIRKYYRYFLPLFPILIENMNVHNYDIVISSSHSVAKGVLTKSYQVHICYCHTPMRYIWDMYWEYNKNLSLIPSLFLRLISNYLRIWDYYSAQRVDYFVANSKYVAKRIKKFYRRDATVIYPPVEVEKFYISPQKEDFYLVVSRLVPYKNIDIVIKAFNILRDRKLIVVGSGPLLKHLKNLASKNIEFLEFIEDKLLAYLMSKAKALIFSAEEDFGIVPVEAQAAGTPVIAYKRGGVVESVIENLTGIFYKENTPQAIVKAIKHFEKIEHSFDPHIIRQNSLKFSRERFRKQFKAFLERVMSQSI